MTLPSSLYDLPTYEQHLLAQGVEPEPAYSCLGCGCRSAPSGFVSTSGLGSDLPAFVCHTCASGPYREALSAQEAAEAPAVDWSGVRAARDALLTRCDWTQMPDAPIDENQREVWRSYRQALRDLSNQFDELANPGDLSWPTPPA